MRESDILEMNALYPGAASALISHAVCCPLGQTHLVQSHGGVFLRQRSRQLLQVLRLLHVMLQGFIKTHVLLEHGARGLVQLPEDQTGKITQDHKSHFGG